jgi:hypothetical protein
MGKAPNIAFDVSKPTGPYNRVCNTTLCQRQLGWSPVVPFERGLKSTIDWYVASHDRDEIRASLNSLLTERGVHLGSSIGQDEALAGAERRPRLGSNNARPRALS